MSNQTACVDVLYAGQIAELGDRKVPSGIFKKAIPGPWTIGPTGLAGDHQGDLVNHGGLEKALHHYPSEHYAAWRRESPDLFSDDAAAPQFGENLCVAGFTEANVCIGDIYRLGSAVLQVSQGRQPCWRLSAKFGQTDMAYRVQQTGRTGWYYRVLEPGRVQAGDLLRLEKRPLPNWPLSRLMSVVYGRSLDRADLEDIAEMVLLSPSWRGIARKRLASHQIEDWSPRLRGGS